MMVCARGPRGGCFRFSRRPPTACPVAGSIDVKRECHFRLSEVFRDYPGIYPSAQQLRRVRMAQIVESDVLDFAAPKQIPIGAYKPRRFPDRPIFYAAYKVVILHRRNSNAEPPGLSHQDLGQWVGLKARAVSRVSPWAWSFLLVYWPCLLYTSDAADE